MKVEQIKDVLIELERLRQGAKGKSKEGQGRLLMRRRVLREKMFARDGEFEGVSTEALIKEANEIYGRAIGDKLTEDALTVRDRLVGRDK